MYVYIYMYVCMYIYINVCVYICIYIYVDTRNPDTGAARTCADRGQKRGAPADDVAPQVVDPDRCAGQRHQDQV